MTSSKVPEDKGIRDQEPRSRGGTSLAMANTLPYFTSDPFDLNCASSSIRTLQLEVKPLIGVLPDVLPRHPQKLPEVPAATVSQLGETDSLVETGEADTEIGGLHVREKEAVGVGKKSGDALILPKETGPPKFGEPP